MYEKFKVILPIYNKAIDVFEYYKECVSDDDFPYSCPKCCSDLIIKSRFEEKYFSHADRNNNCDYFKTFSKYSKKHFEDNKKQIAYMLIIIWLQEDKVIYVNNNEISSMEQIYLNPYNKSMDMAIFDNKGNDYYLNIDKKINSALTIKSEETIEKIFHYKIDDSIHLKGYYP